MPDPITSGGSDGKCGWADASLDHASHPSSFLLSPFLLLEQLDAIPESKLHLTLALLTLPDDGASVERVAAALRKCLAKQRAFSQPVAGVNSFGTRVVFAQARGEERLRELHGAVERGLREECADLEHREEREWRAHCTLFKSGKAASTLPPLDGEEHFGTQWIESVALCRMGGASVALGYPTPAQIALLHMVDFGEIADRQSVLDVCFALEQASYPADEAATRERMELRAGRASELFLVLLRGKEVLGFVNATACGGSLSAETMAEHDDRGRHVCIHSVVVAPSHRGQGLARVMMTEYVERLQRSTRYECAHLLCKEQLVPFYEKCGFVCSGPSAVQHGTTKWFDCSRPL